MEGKGVAVVLGAAESQELVHKLSHRVG